MFRKGTLGMTTALIVASAIHVTLWSHQANGMEISSIVGVHYLPEAGGTRVIMELDRDAEYTSARISNPDRIYFDLSNASFSDDLRNKLRVAGINYLKQVRVAKNRPDVVRMVLDVQEVKSYSVIELQDPFRIVVDLKGARKVMAEPYSSLPLVDPVQISDMSKSNKINDFTNVKILEKNPGPPSLPEMKSTPSIAPIQRKIGSAQEVSAASLQSIQCVPNGDDLKVFIHLDSDAQYTNARISNPDRIYFDIYNAKLSQTFPKRNFTSGISLLKQIRVAQNRPDVVRVVLAISKIKNYSVSELKNPFRIAVELSSSSPAHSESPQVLVSRIPLSSESRLEPAHMPVSVSEAIPTITPTSSIDFGINEASSSSTNEIIDTWIPQPPTNEESAETDPSLEEGSDQSFIRSGSPSGQPQPMGPVDIESSWPQIGTSDSITNSESIGLPFTVTGTFASGFYSSFSRGGGNGDQTVNFVPATAVFDIHGYYRSPNFLDYSVNPEFNLGPQANDAGFQGGNGIRVKVSALQQHTFPLSFRYSNVQLEDVYFGSLSQVSSYTMKNRNKELGMTAGFQRAGWPTANLDWGANSTHSDPMLPEIPDYVSHASHRNATYGYQRWGWDFRGFTSFQKQESDLVSTSADTTDSFTLQQKVTQYQVSARKGFLKDSELYLDGGSQMTSNIFLDQPIDLTARYANATLRLFQNRRWKASLKGGYTSNIAGLLLTRLAGDLGTVGSVAPDKSVLIPLQSNTSFLNLSGNTSVDLTHGFTLFGDVERTEVLTASAQNLGSRYHTISGGLDYSKSLSWGSFSGQYARTFGSGSVTGQSGKIEGQNYSVMVQPGKWEKVQLDFSVRGSDQKISNDQPADQHSFASDGNVAIALFGGIRTRLGGGWQQGSFRNASSDFQTRGFSAKFSIEHSRFQLIGSLNSIFGNSLQSYDRLFSGIGVGSAVLTPLHIIPSDYQGMSLGFHVNPTRKIEVSALWTRSIQHLSGIVTNDFEVLDISVSYNFRQIKIVGGYFNSKQDYSKTISPYPQAERGRFYIRISRIAKFL